jgi:hypothetical protein
LTSRRSPARGRSRNLDTTAPNVVPFAISTGRPATVTVTTGADRVLPPTSSKATTTTITATTTPILAPRNNTTYPAFDAGHNNLADERAPQPDAYVSGEACRGS